MTVNQLMAKLRTQQIEGHGDVEVHMLAHDNSIVESQGTVFYVSHYEKDQKDRSGSDEYLFDITPQEMVYLHG